MIAETLESTCRELPRQLPLGRRRIAQVITRLVPGGASRIVLDLVRAARDSWDMDLIAGPEGLPPDLPGMLRSTSRLHVVSDLVRDLSPLKDFRALLSLTGILRKGRYDVVHAHTSKAGFLGRIAAARAGVPRIIYSPHGSIFLPGSAIPGVSASRILRRIFLAAERLAGKRTHVLTTLSRQEKDVSAALRLVSPERIRVIPNGIDLEKYKDSREHRAAWRGRWGIEEDEILLIAAGRLSPEKGHLHLMEALAGLRGAFPAARLALCGEGPLAAELARAARRLGVEDRVLLAGHVEDIPAALSAGDIFVHPALYEGFGLAPLEAMASGLPVLSTAAGGIPELIRDGESGLLVPPGDSGALARALRSLLASPELRARLARGGQARARGFGQERMIGAYFSLYEGDEIEGAGE